MKYLLSKKYWKNMFISYFELDDEDKIAKAVNKLPIPNLKPCTIDNQTVEFRLWRELHGITNNDLRYLGITEITISNLKARHKQLAVLSKHFNYDDQK